MVSIIKIERKVVKLIVSHSKVETFESCPYRYDLRYNQGIKTIPPDNADNALFLGTALHTGLEKDVQTAIHEYFMSYPVISDAQVNEAMKLEVMIPKAAAMIPPGEHEVKIEDDDFIGFIDLLAPAKQNRNLVVNIRSSQMYMTCMISNIQTMSANTKIHHSFICINTF